MINKCSEFKYMGTRLEMYCIDIDRNLSFGSYLSAKANLIAEFSIKLCKTATNSGILCKSASFFGHFPSFSSRSQTQADFFKVWEQDFLKSAKLVRFKKI